MFTYNTNSAAILAATDAFKNGAVIAACIVVGVVLIGFIIFASVRRFGGKAKDKNVKADTSAKKVEAVSGDKPKTKRSECSPVAEQNQAENISGENAVMGEVKAQEQSNAQPVAEQNVAEETSAEIVNVAAQSEQKAELKTSARNESLKNAVAQVKVAEELKKPEKTIATLSDKEKQEVLASLPEVKKLVLVRYIYSFQARLIQSPAELQQNYCNLMDIVRSCEKVKSSKSWKHVRIYSGRKPLAYILFRGKKLCVAYALNPAEFEETKYRGQDVSDKKKFEKTPMLLKITSARRAKYAEELLKLVFERNGFECGEIEHSTLSLPYETREQLIRRNLVKLFEGSAGVGEAEQVDIETYIRESKAMRDAEQVIRECAADEYGEVPAELDLAKFLRDSVNATEAAETLTDVQASTLVSVAETKKERKVRRRAIINIDALSVNFAAGECITLEELKARNMVAKDATELKVLARGTLDKPLEVQADDFSLDAVKMIALTGGKAVKIK